jgi:hypothetical protein
MESRNKALSHLRKQLRSGRGEEMPMQKVSVMAPDKKGLEEGLNKAKEIMKSGIPDGMMDSMKSEKEDNMESEGHEMSESEDYKSGEYEAESEMSSEDKAPEDMSREELIAIVKKHQEMM